MTTSTTYSWHKAAGVRTRSVRPSVIADVVFLIAASGLVLLGEYWVATAMLVLCLATVPAFFAPTPRIELKDQGVVLLPRQLVVNTHFTFPVVIFVVSVLATVQLVRDLPTGVDVRLYFMVGLAWLGTVLATFNTVKYWGRLVIDTKSVAVKGRGAIQFDDLRVRLVQEKRVAFPYLELTGGGKRNLLLFPVKFYGVEANSLASCLMHLADVSGETRSNYSPELVREMLLFTPDHEVEVGDSVEVRLVARPAATAP